MDCYQVKNDRCRQTTAVLGAVHPDGRVKGGILTAFSITKRQFIAAMSGGK
jgi:hypothetical protein